MKTLNRARIVAVAVAALASALVLSGVLIKDARSDDVGERRAVEVGEDGGLAPPSSGPSSVPTRSLVDRRFVLGRSELGRPIRGAELGNPASERRLLLVGCIHGNECAGMAVARALAAEPAPATADAWIIFDLNPDGFARGTRQNARGVDLNRNFPSRWRPIGQPGSFSYSGPRPASEPETRIAMKLIAGLHPTVSVWFHQHLDLVDQSGGDVSIERRYAHAVELPLVRLPRYPGSAVNWENIRFAGTTAFVVELPPGSVSFGVAERFADAALALVA